jgi:hypothetical protein
MHRLHKMIEIMFFQYNEHEYGIKSTIDGTDLEFIYVPSNETMKFLIPDYGEEFESLYDMLITYDIQPERIDEFINQFEHIEQNVI